MARTFGFGHDWLDEGAFEELLFIELMDCCFSGAYENTQTNGGNELIFPVYPVLPCRDTMQRSRTNSCDLLAQLPSSLSLGSGKEMGPEFWFQVQRISDDQQLIDYVTAQCNISLEQDTLLGDENEGNDHLNSNHFQQPPVVSPVDHDSNVPYNISVDRILLCSTSPMNVLQHVTYNSENSMKNVLVLVRIDNALVFDRDKGWDSLLSTNRWQDPRDRRQLERLLGGEAMMPSPQDPERFSYPIKECPGLVASSLPINLLDSKHTNLELIGKWKIWRCHHWICPKALFMGVRHIVNCEGAKVNRDGLVTLLRECKGLVMLDVRDCSGFDENND
ncbi:unnamed protein product [Prunus armeniaca]